MNIFKIQVVFGHNSAADCPISQEILREESFLIQNFGNGTDTSVP